MEDMVEQVKFIESVVDQNRECHPTPEDIDQFEALVIEAEWVIHDQFRKFVEMFYGTPSIEIKGMIKLDLLWNGLYLDHDVSIVWGKYTMSISFLSDHSIYLECMSLKQARFTAISETWA